MPDTEYNGWANYETWNVAYWIRNDEHIYRSAVDYMKEWGNLYGLYMDWIVTAKMEGEKTPDNISYIDIVLDYKELNKMMKELIPPKQSDSPDNQ